MNTYMFKPYKETEKQWKNNNQQNYNIFLRKNHLIFQDYELWKLYPNCQKVKCAKVSVVLGKVDRLVTGHQSIPPTSLLNVATLLVRWKYWAKTFSQVYLTKNSLFLFSWLYNDLPESVGAWSQNRNPLGPWTCVSSPLRSTPVERS